MTDETNGYCHISIVMKNEEHYEFKMRIDMDRFNFEKWFDDRWMHEPLFHVPGYPQYLAFDNILKLEHEESYGE